MQRSLLFEGKKKASYGVLDDAGVEHRVVNNGRNRDILGIQVRAKFGL